MVRMALRWLKSAMPATFIRHSPRAIRWVSPSALWQQQHGQPLAPAVGSPWDTAGAHSHAFNALAGACRRKARSLNFAGYELLDLGKCPPSQVGLCPQNRGNSTWRHAYIGSAR